LLPPGAEAATISTFFCGDQVCAADAALASAQIPAKTTVTFVMAPPPRDATAFTIRMGAGEFTITRVVDARPAPG
jgi:hypothetical protein